MKILLCNKRFVEMRPFFCRVFHVGETLPKVLLNAVFLFC